MQKSVDVRLDVVLSLQEVFGASTTTSLFSLAFEWYYVPRNYNEEQYAQRAIDAAIRTFEEKGIVPNWLHRVYERRVLNYAYDEGVSIPPPVDPKTGFPPR